MMASQTAPTQKRARPETKREEIEALLGVPVAGARFTGMHQTGRGQAHGGARTELVFTTRYGQEVPGTLLLPADARGPVPAVLYCHAHGNAYAIGRRELIDGRGSLQGAYAPDLLARGFAVLCLDMPCFGDRAQETESALAKACLWHGTTLFGHMLHELACGLSFLAEHPAVDAARLGALGFSMGSTHAFWLAALDTRVRAAVALCSFADLETLVESGAHDGHGPYMTVPGLLARFDTGSLAGLAAPRALFIGAGLKDWSTPAPALARARQRLEAAYAAAADALHVHTEPESGQEETAAMRLAALAFIEMNL